LWTSPYFYDLYFQADTVWKYVQTAGYLMIPIYAVGIAFSLLLLWNLVQVLTTVDAAGARTLSRVMRIRRK